LGRLALRRVGAYAPIEKKGYAAGENRRNEESGK
jgi:hypothetical protein